MTSDYKRAKDTIIQKRKIALLGYRVTYQTIKPDADRVQPLLKMPVPKTSKQLQRLIGLFAYYARWIPNYSDHIRPLIQSSSFPLDNDVVAAIEKLKQILASAVLHPINGNLTLVIDTDPTILRLLLLSTKTNVQLLFFPEHCLLRNKNIRL